MWTLWDNLIKPNGFFPEVQLDSDQGYWMEKDQPLFDLGEPSAGKVRQKGSLRINSRIRKADENGFTEWDWRKCGT